MAIRVHSEEGNETLECDQCGTVVPLEVELPLVQQMVDFARSHDCRRLHAVQDPEGPPPAT